MMRAWARSLNPATPAKPARWTRRRAASFDPLQSPIPLLLHLTQATATAPTNPTPLHHANRDLNPTRRDCGCIYCMNGLFEECPFADVLRVCECVVCRLTR